jgi:hypothetical protein
MIAHNLGIPKIMKLIHQAVVKGFMFCVPDHLHPDRAQFFESAVDGGLVHVNFNGSSTEIFGGETTRRIIDQTLSVKRQKEFPAGHVLEPTAGLNPVPVSAKLPGNMGPAPVPVFIDHCLNNGQVIGGNFAVSDD